MTGASEAWQAPPQAFVEGRFQAVLTGPVVPAINSLIPQYTHLGPKETLHFSGPLPPVSPLTFYTLSFISCKDDSVLQLAQIKNLTHVPLICNSSISQNSLLT